jgi:hypothetical protein
MKDQKAKAAAPKGRENETKKPAYKAPKLVIHSGSDFVRKLGPAQACSGSPALY